MYKYLNYLFKSMGHFYLFLFLRKNKIIKPGKYNP